jgi:hypothetical protein
MSLAVCSTKNTYYTALPLPEPKVMQQPDVSLEPPEPQNKINLSFID